MKAWIARDKSGLLCVFYGIKPAKEYIDAWRNSNDKYFGIDEIDLPEGINPQWSDDEPIEVELKIEKV